MSCESLVVLKTVEIDMKKLLALTALMVAAPVLAHDGMHGPAARFDNDKNGSLSLTEFTALLQANKEDVSKAEERFKALDTNADGKLSSREALPAAPKK
jgi:hypothetical protein